MKNINLSEDPKFARLKYSFDYSTCIGISDYYIFYGNFLQGYFNQKLSQKSEMFDGNGTCAVRMLPLMENQNQRKRNM